MPLCTNCMKQVQSLRTLPGTRGQKQVCKSCFYSISFGKVIPAKPVQTQNCTICGGQTLNSSLICTVCTLNQNSQWQCYNYLFNSKSFFISGTRFSTGSFRIPYSMIYDGVEEMPKATLSYEALQLDSEGIPTEGAYKLKLEGNFKQHIEPIVKFIKATIPSSDRTYDPTTYEWAFHEKYYPLMEQAFKGSHFQVSFTVRKEDFVELKRKQAEFAKQAGQSFATRQYDTKDDLISFTFLLTKAGIDACGITAWTRQEAEKIWKRALRFFHPDLHPERASQASELNEVWSRLKEGYYIK